MRYFYTFWICLSCVLLSGQTILNQPETTSRTVQDPNVIILANGFHASSSSSNPFVARIRTSTENNTDGYSDSNAGSTNPSGTTAPTGMSFHDTKGNIEVNGGGQLQYTLPIALPPGIKSVAPQINLVYTSGAGNGIAGYGWNISGITSISRMGKNMDKDGEIKGIQLDYSDYYSFNGQRLILKSGEYGKDGAEYVTEKYSNVKTKSIGNRISTINGFNVSGPEFWEVTFEDGSQAWYGATTAGANNARTPIEYNIVKWKDHNGNYITYNYSQENNVAVISSIQWGGNETLGKPHFNEIVFNYITRELKEVSYSSGLEYIQSFILNSIQVINHTTQFKRYVIEHENIDSYSRISKITEYNSQNEAANPIKFVYQSNTFVPDENIRELGVKNTHTKKYGDFDFDGVTDFLDMEYNGTLYFKKSVYKSGNEELITYNHNEFSVEDFRQSAVITYKNNNIVGRSAGIVIPVKRYRANSYTEYDYEFRIYAVNLDSKTLDFQYSKTLQYENFKTPYEFQLDTSGCSFMPSTLLSLMAYDHDGDGISEIVTEFSFYKECYDNTDPTNPPPYIVYSQNKNSLDLNTEKDVPLTQQPILLPNNTEYYPENNNKIATVQRTTAISNNVLQPSSMYELSTIFFDLKQETPPERSFAKFNIKFSQTPIARTDFKTADFNGDGIEELFYVENNRITNFYNIKTNFSNYYSVVRVIDDQYLEGLVDNAVLGDYNGDGKVDLAIPQAQKSSNWKIYFSTGKGFKPYDYSNFIYFNSKYEVSNEGSHRNIIFESYCKYNTTTYYQYNAVDLDNDGKSEIVVSKVEYLDHSWNSHSSQEYTKVNLNVYSSNKSSSSIIGETSAPIKFGQTYNKEVNFNGKVIYFTPLFINRTNQQIILTGRPNDCPTSGCDMINVIYLNYNNTPTKMRLSSIDQGNLSTYISYAELLPTGNIYKADEPIAYPYLSLNKVDRSFVVSQLRQDLRLQDFRYRGFLVHLKGKGMIGFRQTARSSWYAEGYEDTKVWSGAEIDPFTESVPTKEWSIKTNDENKIFPTDLSTNNNELLSIKLTNYKKDYLVNGGLASSPLSESDKPKAVLALVPISTVSRDVLKNVKSESSIQYGDYYLPKTTTTKTYDGNTEFATSTTNLEYEPANLSGVGSNYNVGRPKSKTELMQAYGDSKGAKEEYTYENNQLKTQKTWNRDNTAWIRETYSYDGFGNITEKVTSNSTDTKTKSSKAAYDDKGRFVTKKTETVGGLSLQTSITYNNWGQVINQTDPLGVTLTNEYDAWGKLLKSKTNLAGITSYQYEKLYDGGTKVTQYSPDGGVSISYTNNIGQNYKTTTKAFGTGNYISKETKYDALGRKTSESEAYAEGVGASQWNNITYDSYSRPIKATAFTGKIVETTYTGRTATITETNANNRFKKQTADPLGNISSSEDKGGTIYFKYNAAGENIEARYDTNIVITKYDSWGRKIEFNDPSNGLYRYEYNDGFGQLTKEISPKGYKEYFYNAEGQLYQQKEATVDGTQNTSKTISFSYNAKGLITSKAGTANGKQNGQNITKNFSTALVYDRYGRVLSTTESSNGKYFIQKGMVYDDLGRVTSYEKGLYSSGTYTKTNIENVYDAWSGILYQVKDKTSTKVLWELQEANAKGQVTKALLGAATITNTYDNSGFLNNINHSAGSKPTILQISYRFNAIKNELNSRTTGGDFSILESFEYDDNNRLINWTDPVTNAFAVGSKRNVYDAKGRITQNDQLGDIKFENNQFVYRPTSVTLNAVGQQNLNNDLIQSIIYNENNDPVFINGVKGDVRFEYGLTEMRQMATYGGNFDDNTDGKFTKYYSEDGSFEIIRNNQTGEEKHMLYIGGTPYESNIVFLKNYNENNGSYKFLHKDYLGSILAITNEAGDKLEQRHFDAWGNLTQLKIGNNATITDKTQIRDYLANGNLVIDRGYTSHEHFAEVGLIHMNGRLYDPLLRRFLNADENIQDMFNTQNYNKYGYVLNNPLMFNDPSGEFAFLAFLAIPLVKAILIGAAVGLASYTLGLAVTGNIDQWKIGGALKSMFWGAVSGAVTFGIGNIFSVAGEGGKMMATALASSIEKGVGSFGLAIIQGGTHAISQGVLSLMQGGDFLSGAAAGFLGHMGGELWGATMKGVGLDKFAQSTMGMVTFGAISGGIGAELSGGNFWQGAVTGGIVAGLNSAMHKMTGPGDGNDSKEQKQNKNRRVYSFSKEQGAYGLSEGLGVFAGYTIEGNIILDGNKITVLASGSTIASSQNNVYFIGEVTISGTSEYATSTFKKTIPLQKNYSKPFVRNSDNFFIGEASVNIPGNIKYFNVTVKAGYSFRNGDGLISVPIPANTTYSKGFKR